VPTPKPRARRPGGGLSVGITSVRVHVLLLVLSAVALGLCFPRSEGSVVTWVMPKVLMRLLAHVALVPMLVLAVRSAAPRVLAITAYLVFFVWWLGMIWWMMPVTVGGTILLSAGFGVYSLLVLLLVRRLDRQLNVPMTLALPLVWVSLEWLRGRMFGGHDFFDGGFGWVALSYTQAPCAPGTPGGAALRLIQVADVFGEWGVSFLVAMSNGLVVDLLVRPLFVPTAEGKRRLRPRLVVCTVLWVLCLTAAYIYGEFRIRQTERYLSPGPRVTVIQTNVPQSNKNHPTAESERQDWQAMLDLTDSAAPKKPDLVVWPETMVYASLDATSVLSSKAPEARGDSGVHTLTAAEYDDQMRALAASMHAWILVGAHARHWTAPYEAPDGRRLVRADAMYNSAFLYGPNGLQSATHYDKVHLVPFGEYIPWLDDWPWLKNIFIKYISPYPEDYSLRPGTAATVFDIRFPAAGGAASSLCRVGTPICFEDGLARSCRPMIYAPDGSKRADALINMTNDGWFARSSEQPQHLQLAVFRCIENRVPMARSVNTGISGFIDSTGRIGPIVVQRGHTQQVAGSCSAELRLDARRTVFGMCGEWPVGALTVGTAFLLLLSCVGPVRRRSAGAQQGGGGA
jgi:apolipoprotein N-acyltransferase